MPKFAANLSMMYTEHDFPDRFAAAAADGFRAVEYLFPYEYTAAQLRLRLDEHGLEQVLFNAPPGDWDAGERGFASVPGREAEFCGALERALEYAVVLGSPQIHVMAGIVAPEEGITERARRLDTFESNLARAAETASQAGVDILIEPINGRDMPGYFLSRQAAAHAVVQRVGASNLKVQLDLYHCQIVEGDLTTTLQRDLPTGRVGHLQVAGVPERNEPDGGELNIRHLFDVIDRTGYDGWIGCEYRPRAGTSDGLAWLTAREGAGA